MKRWVVGLSAGLMLMGCADNSDEEVEDDREEIEEDTSTEENSADIEEDTEANEDDNTNEVEADSEEFVFVPQQADLDNGLTIENDETLSVLDELVSSSEPDDLGLPDDITLQYTGLYFYSETELQPVFVLTNRTDQSFTNIEMSFTYGEMDGELLFDDHPIHLDEETFGILEPNTVMPLYVDADAEQFDFLVDLSETRNEQIEINSIDFETID